MVGNVPQQWDTKRERFVMLVNPRANRLRDLDSNDEVFCTDKRSWYQ